jgi:hypothetical protein
MFKNNMDKLTSPIRALKLDADGLMSLQNADPLTNGRLHLPDLLQNVCLEPRLETDKVCPVVCVIIHICRKGRFLQPHILVGEEEDWPPGSVNFNAGVEICMRLLRVLCRWDSWTGNAASKSPTGAKY